MHRMVCSMFEWTLKSTRSMNYNTKLRQCRIRSINRYYETQTIQFR